MPKPDVSELRTAQIIEAAIAVFSEKGFHEARMEDISHAAGLSKGTIYLYFKDKDALIKAIAIEFFKQEQAELSNVCNMPGTSEEKIQTLMESMVIENDEIEIAMPIIFEFYALSVRRADVQQILSNHLRISVECIKEILQQGVEQNEFPPLDTEKVAAILLALQDGILARMLYTSKFNDTREQLQFGVDLLLKGLKN